MIRKTLLLISLSLLAVSGYADVHIKVPQQGEPPQYTSAAGPAFEIDGSITVIHDGEWAAIPFWRLPACVPPNFNLLVQVDAPAAFGCELLVEGFVRLQRGTFNIMSWEARGVDEVPVWFVSLSELQAAMADQVLTMTEINAMSSLEKGSATTYNEQNHTFANHQVSHLSMQARGTLEDGRSFRLSANEVALDLIFVDIDFY